MPATFVEIPGSHRDAPHDATAVRELPPGEPIEVSVYLKERDQDPMLELPPVAAGDAAGESFASHYSAGVIAAARADFYAEDIDKLVDFAREAGLTVTKQEPGRRLVKLSGPAEKIEAAFGTKLYQYHDGKRTFRGRAGKLYVPQTVADAIDAVLGLDTRPVATPRLAAAADPHVVVGHKPNEVARLYGFPATAGAGKGQCVALIELGGGFRASDNAQAFAAMGLAVPQVVPISVDNAQNRPGVDPNADGEVALDIQVVGGAAPGARIAVYFAPDTAQGFVDAISRAVHDQQNRPSVISISWGAPEERWTGQAITAMTGALRDAARLGVTVFAASGDNLATDGLHDGKAHVDFPASSPYVLGCGGTRIDTSQTAIVGERVWNTGRAGTGGGVSNLFPVPAYQAHAKVPNSVTTQRPGRGVPDVAGNADPSSGYRIIVGGASGLIGGTSAVAPLWAGLFALCSEACGRPLGFVHPLLYGNVGVFRDVSAGNNRDGQLGYDAGQGWDACTGLGVPVGRAVLQMFATASHAAPAIAAE